MKRYVPRSARGQESRAAAIWALGYLHENMPDEGLADDFGERLADIEGTVPEDERVRRMSAVSIGRMKNENEVVRLQRFAGWRSPSGVACLWSISRMKNEPMPEREVYYEEQRGWFLEPVN
jgi:hypothetical protein